MLATIIIIFSILFFFCAATWILGIIENVGETRVMSLRTYLRLCKNGDVFDIDQAMGVGYGILFLPHSLLVALCTKK